MRTSNNKGFVLLVVVAFIALIPAAIMLMSRDTAMLVADNNTTLLSAQCHNLLTSGLAWIEKNSTILVGKEVGWQKELDVTVMDIQGGRCSITIKEIRQNAINVELKAQSSHGKRVLKRSLTYTVKK